MTLAAFTLRRAPARIALFLFVNALGLLGCAAEPVRHPLPAKRTDQAVVPGLPADVRYWGDDPAAAFSDWLSVPADELGVCCAGLMDRSHNYLVVSSGGVDGAFGAGLFFGKSDGNVFGFVFSQVMYQRSFRLRRHHLHNG